MLECFNFLHLSKMEKDISRELKEGKGIKEPTKEEIGEKIVEEWHKKQEEKQEFLTEREKIIREKLEEELAKMELSPESKEEVEEKAKKVGTLDEKGKVKHLLALAEEKGLSFMVGVARGMNDPYTLDILHDILVRNELYKRFSK